MSLAPIALFAFKRPNHLQRCLESLKLCREFYDSELHIFIDGARNPADSIGVNRVREIVAELVHPAKYVTVQPQNRGLARSITEEVSRLTKQYGKIIVLEDDLIVHPCALEWFNSGLTKFAEVEPVMQVGGYQYSVPEFARRQEGTFQRFVTTWGWATWLRAWEKYDPTTAGWQDVLNSPVSRRSFDMDGTYPYAGMISKLHKGEIDSWGIRWYYTVFKEGGISLMPPQTLVQNDGFDGEATHNTVGILKRFVSGPRPPMWTGNSAPELPQEAVLLPDDEAAFRQGLLRTNALRNDKIKGILASLGLKRFR